MAPATNDEANRTAQRPAPPKQHPGEPPRRTTVREPGATSPGIADADKIVRTGRKDEPVRNTPPSGDWNDVA
jgi:hypothetical protein